MKIWKFYMKPENENQVTEKEIRQSYPMYGCTNIKKFAKRFKETRKMDQFIERVTEVDDEVGKEYLSTRRNRLLTEYTLQTVIRKPNGDYEPYYVKCISTENEMEYMSEITDTDQILNMVTGFFSLDLFVNKVAKALIAVQYDKFIKVRLNGLGQLPDGILSTYFHYDMFRTFMLLYGHTFVDDFVATQKYLTEDQITDEEWKYAAKTK